MAAVGFVHKGAEEGTDYVECFMCGIGLDGWEAGDDPLYVRRLIICACVPALSEQRKVYP